jgi:hypothetical protein
VRRSKEVFGWWFKVATAVSLLFCIASAAMWVRSNWREDGLLGFFLHMGLGR